MLRENGEQVHMNCPRWMIAECQEGSLNPEGIAPLELDSVLQSIKSRRMPKFEPEELSCERWVGLCVHPCGASEQVLTPMHA